ncbi:hypothetical protein FVE85_1501 [Porphyridium purpureum]|uniref:Uncharacterized protein n=1 Tax=Porphyridium purpureum TaxID=35688 RepID=A0A5J4YVF6_PORPP|nr:hypothetical protein FVE85_1501 [Porphyridium purpureum]|eukprot:POR8318..scf209_3
MPCVNECEADGLAAAAALARALAVPRPSPVSVFRVLEQVEAFLGRASQCRKQCIRRPEAELLEQRMREENEEKEAQVAAHAAELAEAESKLARGGESTHAATEHQEHRRRLDEAERAEAMLKQQQQQEELAVDQTGRNAAYKGPLRALASSVVWCILRLGLVEGPLRIRAWKVIMRIGELSCTDDFERMCGDMMVYIKRPLDRLRTTRVARIKASMRLASVPRSLSAGSGSGSGEHAGSGSGTSPRLSGHNAAKASARANAILLKYVTAAVMASMVMARSNSTANVGIDQCRSESNILSSILSSFAKMKPEFLPAHDAAVLISMILHAYARCLVCDPSKSAIQVSDTALASVWDFARQNVAKHKSFSLLCLSIATLNFSRCEMHRTLNVAHHNKEAESGRHPGETHRNREAATAASLVAEKVDASSLFWGPYGRQDPSYTDELATLAVKSLAQCKSDTEGRVWSAVLWKSVLAQSTNALRIKIRMVVEDELLAIPNRTEKHAVVATLYMAPILKSLVFSIDATARHRFSAVVSTVRLLISHASMDQLRSLLDSVKNALHKCQLSHHCVADILVSSACVRAHGLSKLRALQRIVMHNLADWIRLGGIEATKGVAGNEHTDRNRHDFCIALSLSDRLTILTGCVSVENKDDLMRSEFIEKCLTSLVLRRNSRDELFASSQCRARCISFLVVLCKAAPVLLERTVCSLCDIMIAKVTTAASCLAALHAKDRKAIAQVQEFWARLGELESAATCFVKLLCARALQEPLFEPVFMRLDNVLETLMQFVMLRLSLSSDEFGKPSKPSICTGGSRMRTVLYVLMSALLELRFVSEKPDELGSYSSVSIGQDVFPCLRESLGLVPSLPVRGGSASLCGCMLATASLDELEVLQRERIAALHVLVGCPRLFTLKSQDGASSAIPQLRELICVGATRLLNICSRTLGACFSCPAHGLDLSASDPNVSNGGTVSNSAGVGGGSERKCVLLEKSADVALSRAQMRLIDYEGAALLVLMPRLSLTPAEPGAKSCFFLSMMLGQYAARCMPSYDSLSPSSLHCDVTPDANAAVFDPESPNSKYALLFSGLTIWDEIAQLVGMDSDLRQDYCAYQSDWNDQSRRRGDEPAALGANLPNELSALHGTVRKVINVLDCCVVDSIPPCADGRCGGGDPVHPFALLEYASKAAVSIFSSGELRVCGATLEHICTWLVPAQLDSVKNARGTLKAKGLSPVFGAAIALAVAQTLSLKELTHAGQVLSALQLLARSAMSWFAAQIVVLSSLTNGHVSEEGFVFVPSLQIWQLLARPAATSLTASMGIGARQFPIHLMHNSEWVASVGPECAIHAMGSVLAKECLRLLATKVGHELSLRLGQNLAASDALLSTGGQLASEGAGAAGALEWLPAAAASISVLNGFVLREFVAANLVEKRLEQRALLEWSRQLQAKSSSAAASSFSYSSKTSSKAAGLSVAGLPGGISSALAACRLPFNSHVVAQMAEPLLLGLHELLCDDRAKQVAVPLVDIDAGVDHHPQAFTPWGGDGASVEICRGALAVTLSLSMCVNHRGLSGEEHASGPDERSGAGTRGVTVKPSQSALEAAREIALVVLFHNTEPFGALARALAFRLLAEVWSLYNTLYFTPAGGEQKLCGPADSLPHARGDGERAYTDFDRSDTGLHAKDSAGLLPGALNLSQLCGSDRVGSRVLQRISMDLRMNEDAFWCANTYASMCRMSASAALQELVLCCGFLRVAEAHESCIVDLLAHACDDSSFFCTALSRSSEIQEQHMQSPTAISGAGAFRNIIVSIARRIDAASFGAWIECISTALRLDVDSEYGWRDGTPYTRTPGLVEHDLDVSHALEAFLLYLARNTLERLMDVAIDDESSEQMGKDSVLNRLAEDGLVFYVAYFESRTRLGFFDSGVYDSVPSAAVENALTQLLDGLAVLVLCPAFQSFALENGEGIEKVVSPCRLLITLAVKLIHCALGNVAHGRVTLQVASHALYLMRALLTRPDPLAWRMESDELVSLISILRVMPTLDVTLPSHGVRSSGLACSVWLATVESVGLIIRHAFETQKWSAVYSLLNDSIKDELARAHAELMHVAFLFAYEVETKSLARRAGTSPDSQFESDAVDLLQASLLTASCCGKRSSCKQTLRHFFDVAQQSILNVACALSYTEQVVEQDELRAILLRWSDCSSSSESKLTGSDLSSDSSWHCVLLAKSRSASAWLRMMDSGGGAHRSIMAAIQFIHSHVFSAVTPDTGNEMNGLLEVEERFWARSFFDVASCMVGYLTVLDERPEEACRMNADDDVHAGDADLVEEHLYDMMEQLSRVFQVDAHGAQLGCLEFARRRSFKSGNLYKAVVRAMDEQIDAGSGGGQVFITANAAVFEMVFDLLLACPSSEAGQVGSQLSANLELVARFAANVIVVRSSSAPVALIDDIDCDDFAEARMRRVIGRLSEQGRAQIVSSILFQRVHHLISEMGPLFLTFHMKALMDFCLNWFADLCAELGTLSVAHSETALDFVEIMHILLLNEDGESLSVFLANSRALRKFLEGVGSERRERNREANLDGFLWDLLIVLPTCRLQSAKKLILAGVARIVQASPTQFSDLIILSSCAWLARCVEERANRDAFLHPGFTASSTQTDVPFGTLVGRLDKRQRELWSAWVDVVPASAKVRLEQLSSSDPPSDAAERDLSAVGRLFSSEFE